MQISCLVITVLLMKNNLQRIIISGSAIPRTKEIYLFLVQLNNKAGNFKVHGLPVFFVSDQNFVAVSLSFLCFFPPPPSISFGETRRRTRERGEIKILYNPGIEFSKC